MIGKLVSTDPPIEKIILGQVRAHTGLLPVIITQREGLLTHDHRAGLFHTISTLKHFRVRTPLNSTVVDLGFLIDPVITLLDPSITGGGLETQTGDKQDRLV
ncbi:MAG: hypothetical protein ACRCW3_02660 [Metamycoplasmataceae bacterium]